ncbi:coiled-coil domain-containing protein 18-like isoform X1 [Fagus crenata]
MFRLHKNRHAKSGERVDFNFSNFKALQVPRGWDKLLVSITSVESGKTIAKSSKALVHNGSCQWTDTLSETICVSQDDSSKELQDCFFKLVVSMGSARSGILGEATVNMTGYMSSPAPVPVSLRLKKCNHGTILQVKIHCLTPRTKLRDEESKETNLHIDQEANFHDLDSKSDGSESTFARSIGSSSSKDLGSTLDPGEPGSRETSFSASGSYHSYDSAEGSIGRETFSPRNNLSSDQQSLIGGQESISSQNGVSCGSNSGCEPLQSNHSSFNSRLTGSGNHSQNSQQDFETSSLKPAGSSKNIMEAAKVSVEELHAEAKMWERNARKLMLDLDLLRKEFSDQSKNVANLKMGLSAACSERDELKKEVEQLKMSLEKPMVKQTATEDSKFEDEGLSHIQKELRDELKFQKESNANLALQLQGSQASNLELVSVLQELEETIEKQKIEIENLSGSQSKFGGIENFIEVNIEENRNLMIQLQQLQESEKSLQDKVQLLEQALEEKNHHIENEGSLNNQTLLDSETEDKGKDGIVSLKAKSSESLKGRHFPNTGSINDGDVNMIRQIEVLQEKVQELERDCNELTDENLELLFKLKEATKNSMVGGTSFDLPHQELSNKSFTSFESEVSGHISQTHYPEDKFKWTNLRETEDNDKISTQELESLNMKLGKELADKISEIAKLESKLQSKEEEVGVLKQSQSELEASVSNLQMEKGQLEEQMEVVQRESDITSKCLSDLRNDLMALSSSLDSHVSANKILERKSSELENGKRELELCISELEQENVQLSVQISGLEDELRYLTDEKESNQLELENSNSNAQSLQDEITRLRTEIDSEKVYMKEKLHEMQMRWSEAQEECEYFRRANPKLKATAESLIEECSTLQKSNGELRKQKMELHNQCSLLEAKLRESQRNFADCSKRVEMLEENLSSTLEEIASKEKSLTSELDALLDENRRHKEKIIMGEDLLNQMCLENNVEVENLQREVEHLTKQLSENHEDKERLASDAVLEVSNLRADKANLKTALQEAQSKMKLIENELDIVQIESESNLQSLMGELAASKQNHAMLMADHEKVLRLLENYKSETAKFKTTVNGLELKLTVSENERQQLVEESKNFKVQLQNMAHLHDEVLTFKNELDATKFEKEKLETSLNLISGEHEDLKAENILLVEKISAFQKPISELEDCKRNRVILEEKLLQMEGNLMAKEVQSVQETELKNELSHIRKANRQYQRKIQLLEEEKDQCVTKVQALEEELKLLKEGKQNQRESSSMKISSFSKTNTKVTPVHEDMRPSKKNEMVKNNSQHRDNKRKQSLKNGQVQEVVKDQQKLDSNQYQREDDSSNEILDGSPLAVGVDPSSKIQLLESELAKAMEANNIYKAQLDRLSESQKSHTHSHTKSTAEDDIVTKDSNGRTNSSLEAELIDIRERYLNMSLKYAEVENQREELVMKLKAAKNVKRWFS